VKKLKVPVMNNLDNLTDDELRYYFSVWSNYIASKKIGFDEDPQSKLDQLTQEIKRRNYDAIM